MAINDVRNDSLYGSNKVIVGTKYADLILETLGKVYVKTGNSSRVLNDVFKLLDNADDSGNSIILVNSLLEMESMEYPGDGYFIFNTLTKGLYLSYDDRYILLIEAAEGADLGYVRRSGDTMTGLLEIVTKTAPLIVASSKLVRNFNAEYVNGFSSDDLAKRKLDEYIIGRWSFNNITTFNDNIVANDNIRAYKDIVLSGSIGSPEFASGFGGYGWRFDANTNMLTVDYLVVRKAMKVYELVINNISATNGALWVTNASKCEESKIPLYLDDTYTPGDLTGKTWYIPITSNSNNVSEVVIKGLNLANSDGTNPGDLTFINHRFAVYINDIQKVLNSPRFLGINSITDEAILNLELDDDFSLNVKICYLFAKDSSNNIIWYNENTTPKFYFINKNRVTVNSDSHLSYYNGEVDELYLYYKYFAILKEEYLASLLSNKQVPHIRLVTTDTSLYPSFKEGDLIRCLKYSYGNMKYYDAIVGTQFESNTFVMFRASSVFDKYTEVSYDEFGNVINYKEEYNTQLYLKTTQTIDLDSILDDITALDNMVQVGNITNPERLNSVYITSAEDNSPFIDIITDLNRPDWSVLYYVPNYLTEVRYVEEYGMRKRCKLYLLNTQPTEVKYWTWVDKGITYYGTLTPTKETNVLYYSEEAQLKLCKFTTTTKVRLGNLSGITNDMFKTSLPYGYGLYGENVFLTGEFYLSNGLSVVEFTKDQIRLEILGSVSKNYILNSRGPFEIKNTTLESPDGEPITVEFTKLFLLKKPLTIDSDMYIYWTELDTSGEINQSLSHIRAFLKFKDLDSPLQEVYNNTTFKPNNEYDALIIKGNNYLGSVEKLMLSLGTTKYDWEPAELDVIGSSFEMTEDGITLVGKEILLKGKIKFEYLDGLTLDNLNYLTQNLRDATKESTLILGGLILSNTLALGKTETVEGSEEDEKKFTIYSGLSGNYDESQVGNGISYWSGGDAFDRDSMPPELYPEGIRPASSLIRMDGSGYLANGNIEWDVDGNLHVNPLTFWIDIVGGESETLEKILNKLVNLFSPVYEDPLNDLSPIVGIYAKYPLAVLGGITQYAGVPLTLPSIFEGLPIDGDTIYWELDSSGNKAVLKAKGGSGGGGGDLDSTKLWLLLEASTTEQINKSHLTDALSGYITNNTTFWGQSVKNNIVSGNMTNVGLINDSIRIEGGFDKATIRGNGHGIIFGGGNGYAHCTYAFRPEWGSQSETQCNLKIQNASAATSNPSYTTTHEFVSDGTAYHRTRVRVARTDGEGSGIYTNTIHASDWFRSEGDTGWYSETYGGGWYMTDYNLIRAYNNKTIYTGGGLQTQGDIEIKGAGVFTTSNNTILRKKGYSNTDILRWDWNGTDGDHLKFTIPGTNDQSKYMKLSSGNGLVVTARIEGNNFNAKSNVSTYFSAYNSINEAISGSDPDYKWTWYHAKSGDVQRGFTLWSYAYGGAANQVASFIAYGGNTFKSFGNILATGGITQYSDLRAKTIIEQINLSLKDIANSPAIRFKWNGWKQKDDNKTHVGGIAQYIQKVLPEVIYNSDDLLTMDYATTGYIFSVNTAKHLLNYETKTDKEINKLKERIRYLENQLKKLGYEEANIVDN